MSFPAEILRSGISLANELTLGVQCQVKFEACTGQNANGRTYAAPVYLSAVVDFTAKERVSAVTDKVQTIAATIMVVGDVKPNGTIIANNPRREPVDDRDRLTLPNGFTGPIISAPGSVVDPATNRGFIHVIEIGAV